MSRSFDLHAESPADVDDVHAAFGDQRYWAARLALTDTGTATLESLTIDGHGTVDVVVKFNLFRDRLPRVVAQFGLGDLEMTHTEQWARTGEGCVRGDLVASVSGSTVAARGQVVLAPTSDGSQLNGNGSVSSRIPLIGGRLEGFLGTQLSKQIVDMQRFTSNWIAENR